MSFGLGALGRGREKRIGKGMEWGGLEGASEWKRTGNEARGNEAGIEEQKGRRRRLDDSSAIDFRLRDGGLRPR